MARVQTTPNPSSLGFAAWLVQELRRGRNYLVTQKGESQHQDVGDNEAEGEDLCWGEACLKQHLRKNKGAAPDGYSDKGHQMILNRIQELKY